MSAQRNKGILMKRSLRVLVLACALVMAFSVPASAHIIEVTNPHTGEPVSTHKGKAHEWVKEFGDFGWVGGGGASHGTGLIDACHATADNAVVRIWGPPNPETCHHGF